MWSKHHRGDPPSAMFVDEILKGIEPTDLPIEQPTKFELAINLKAVKALGLTLAARPHRRHAKRRRHDGSSATLEGHYGGRVRG